MSRRFFRRFCRLTPHHVWIAVAALFAYQHGAWAGEADVTGAKITHRSGRIYDFDVTIRSNDTGWERYADRIEILGPDGKALGTRVLEHPHETEQPFTRDVYGVEIPGRVTEVTIRAHYKPTGYDGTVLRVPVK